MWFLFQHFLFRENVAAIMIPSTAVNHATSPPKVEAKLAFCDWWWGGSLGRQIFTYENRKTDDLMRVVWAHVATRPGVVWSQTRRCRRLAASWRCCPIPSLCIITDMLSDNARCCCTLLHKNSSPTGAHPASSWEVPVTPQPLSSLLTPQPSPAQLSINKSLLSLPLSLSPLVSPVSAAPLSPC